MKIQTGTLNLILYPENDEDKFNLGIISKNLPCRTEFIQFEPKGKELNNLQIKFQDLINFLLQDIK